MMTLIGILGFLVAFGLAVFIHELGHFLAAKAFKVPVERFVIGFDKEAIPVFPRCIFEKKFGETTYGISLIPLGGYVKMAGIVHPEIQRYLDGEDANTPKEQPAEPAVRSDTLAGQAMQDQAALYKKPFWQKFIIYSAGVIMNLILAMLVVTVSKWRGVEEDVPLPAVVSWSVPDSWARKNDLLPGDVILAVNEKPISNDKEFEDAWEGAFPEEADGPTTATIALLVSREGVESHRKFQVGSKDEVALKGLYQLTSIPAHIHYAMLNQPAKKAGLKRGDIFVEIDGQAIFDYYQAANIIRTSLGKELHIKTRRTPARIAKGDSEFFEVTVVPTESTTEPGIGMIGIMPGTVERLKVAMPFFDALYESPLIVADNVKLYVSNLKRLGSNLVQGNVNSVRKELGGPVVIAQMAGYHAQLGLEDFLKFMIMLNIALAVMNILPFPVLDGGHICLAAFEAVFKRPVPPRILVPVLNGAVFVILAFAVLVTFSDFFNIFSK